MDGNTDDPNPQGESTDSEESPDDLLLQMQRRILELRDQDEKLDDRMKLLKSEMEKIEKMKSDAKEKFFIMEREEGQRQINLETFGMQMEQAGEFWFCNSCKRQLASPYKPKFCPLCETPYSVTKMQIRGASNEAELKMKLGFCFDSE